MNETQIFRHKDYELTCSAKPVDSGRPDDPDTAAFIECLAQFSQFADTPDELRIVAINVCLR